MDAFPRESLFNLLLSSQDAPLLSSSHNPTVCCTKNPLRICFPANREKREPSTFIAVSTLKAAKSAVLGLRRTRATAPAASPARSGRCCYYQTPSSPLNCRFNTNCNGIRIVFMSQVCFATKVLRTDWNPVDHSRASLLDIVKWTSQWRWERLRSWVQQFKADAFVSLVKKHTDLAVGGEIRRSSPAQKTTTTTKTTDYNIKEFAGRFMGLCIKSKLPFMTHFMTLWESSSRKKSHQEL